MGYLHNTIEYLPFALETMVKDGGCIYMHMNIPESKLQDVELEIKQTCGRYGYSSSVSMQLVKNYSPGMGHYVFDITLTSEA